MKMHKFQSSNDNGTAFVDDVLQKTIKKKLSTLFIDAIGTRYPFSGKDGRRCVICQLFFRPNFLISDRYHQKSGFFFCRPLCSASKLSVF